MGFFEWSMMIGMVTMIGFLWKLSQDMRKLESSMNRDMVKLESRLTKEVRDLGERVAKIEGTLLHGIGFKQDKPVGTLHDLSMVYRVILI